MARGDVYTSMAAPRAALAADERQIQNANAPATMTIATPAVIDQRATLDLCSPIQLALDAAAWANLSFFRA